MGKFPTSSNILSILPNTNKRYVPIPLFENVATEITKKKHEISRYTPNFRFDVLAQQNNLALRFALQ
jgi:hypothetical protein